MDVLPKYCYCFIVIINFQPCYYKKGTHKEKKNASRKTINIEIEVRGITFSVRLVFSCGVPNNSHPAKLSSSSKGISKCHP